MSDHRPIIKVIEEAYEIPQLGATRKISALLPHNYYNSTTRYPVLYLQDGQNLFNPEAPYGDWAIDQSLGTMAGQGLRDIIVIAIDHGEQERIKEYLPYRHPKFGRGKGQFYIRFLKEKLIPYVNKNFRTKTGYEHTGIGGSSMGGLISLFAGFKSPDVFGKLMIFSPSLWISGKIFTDAAKFKPLPKSRVYLYAGGKESHEHLPNVRSLEAILQRKMELGTFFDFATSVDMEGQHAEAYWREEFPKAVKWLFFKKPTMQFLVKKSFDQHLDIVLPFYQGALDHRRIKDLTTIGQPDFEGKFGEQQKLYGTNGRRVYLLGLGKADDAPRLQEAFRKFSYDTSKFRESDLQVDCRHLSDRVVGQIALGFEMATYDLGAFKSESKPEVAPGEPHAVVLVSRQDGLEEIVQAAQEAGESINRIKGLVDAPANYKTPQYLADWAKDSAAQYGYECEVIEHEDLRKKGFGALLAVGAGSIHPPRLIVVKHLSDPNGKIDLGLAGKGITFDSGGLSIKPSDNMHYMKSDMGGAAAVLGAVELAAKYRLDLNVIGVIAAAENAVDSKSFRPSDVIDSYSGKRIEIIDTDAEGRLVLADALSYIIRTYDPTYLIDLATLTGSVVRTFGYTAAGVFTNNSAMADHLSKIGDHHHERVWHLPMYKDYEADLHSDVADIRNFSGKPIAGAIMAAKFLEAFTEGHKRWAHLDIAGVAFGGSDYAKMKSATGYGVRLLVGYMKMLEGLSKET